MTDDKVKNIGVKFKQPPEDSGPMLRVVQYEGCNHRWQVIGGKVVNAQYLIRIGETEVECGLCNTRIDPMFVLRQLAESENRWDQNRRVYQAEMARLNERKQTKCHNCGKMTSISRR